MKRLLLILSAALLLGACHHSKEMDPAFIKGDGLYLQSGGKTVLQYDPLTWQLGYSSTRKEFRAFSDDQSAYYVLTCKSLPSKVGESVTADLEWATASGTVRKESGLSLTVKQFDDDGRIWLWNSKKGIGLVVQILQK